MGNVTLHIEDSLLDAVERAGREEGIPREEFLPRLLAEALATRDDLAEGAGRDYGTRQARLLSTLAHEVRTPLSSVLILADLLGENPSGGLSAGEVEYCHKIRHAVADVLQLLTDVVTLARIEAGRIALNPAAVSLARVMEELEETFRPQVRDRPLRFEITVEDEIASTTLRTDRERLIQVLSNLLTGAFRVTQEGEIRLRAYRPRAGEGEAAGEGGNAGRVAIAVSDTSWCIPPEQRETLFEPLHTADLRTSREHGGMGLHLAIAHRLAGALGGRLVLRSTPAEGTTFTLYLPEAGAASSS